VKSIFNLAYLSSGLFFMLSCANSPSIKHSDIKETNVSDTTQAVKKQGNAALSRIAVLSGNATMLLPDEFERMDAGILSSKYLQKGHQPTEVYTNEEGTINIALNYTQNKAEEKDLPAVKKTMESQFKSANH
jgi:hypothetical protein